MTFSAACTQPRSAIIYLLSDSNPPSIENIMGLGQVGDTGAGTISRNFIIREFPGVPRGMVHPRVAAATPRAHFVYAGASCNAGAGISLDSLILDVVGHQ